jgi:biopolymer transport protein ExbB/TolQ
VKKSLPALLKRTYLINLFSREKIHAPSGSIGEEEKILHEYRLMVDRCLAVTSGSLHTLKVLTSVLPLLGLFGTVLGMLETFREIRDFGMGNPSFLTGGIQKALMTTQAGLMTALPVFVLHHIVSALHRKASLRGKRVEKYLSEIILELKKAYTSNQLNPLHFGFGHSKVSIKTG